MLDESKQSAEPRGYFMTSILIVLGVFALWFVLQMWVLPKMGVPT